MSSKNAATHVSTWPRGSVFRAPMLSKSTLWVGKPTHLQSCEPVWVACPTVTPTRGHMFLVYPPKCRPASWEQWGLRRGLARGVPVEGLPDGPQISCGDWLRLSFRVLNSQHRFGPKHRVILKGSVVWTPEFFPLISNCFTALETLCSAPEPEGAPRAPQSTICQLLAEFHLHHLIKAYLGSWAPVLCHSCCHHCGPLPVLSGGSRAPWPDCLRLLCLVPPSHGLKASSVVLVCVLSFLVVPELSEIVCFPSLSRSALRWSALGWTKPASIHWAHGLLHFWTSVSPSFCELWWWHPQVWVWVWIEQARSVTSGAVSPQQPEQPPLVGAVDASLGSSRL